MLQDDKEYLMNLPANRAKDVPHVISQGPIKVSPGLRTVISTAIFAWAPLCGCTLGPFGTKQCFGAVNG